MIHKILPPMICLSALFSPLTAEPSELEKDLLEKSYHTTEFPLSYAAIQEAVEAYQEFLSLPQEIKEHIAFKIDSNKRRSDVGYFLRTSEGTHFDDKEFFHFHPAILKREKQFLEENPTVKNFADKAAALWDAAVATTRKALEQMEDRYPGITAKHLDRDEPEVFLRFLQYRPKGDGTVLAKGHYDAGSMTLAIAESGPGLRIADKTDTLLPITHQDGSAVFFLGSTFPSVTHDNTFHPAWHDVIRVKNTDASVPEERWAVVCFFNAEGAENESWEANHRVQ